jgi:hypothetical protein
LLYTSQRIFSEFLFAPFRKIKFCVTFFANNMVNLPAVPSRSFGKAKKATGEQPAGTLTLVEKWPLEICLKMDILITREQRSATASTACTKILSDSKPWHP